MPEDLMNADLKVGIGKGEYKQMLVWPDDSDRFRMDMKPRAATGSLIETDLDGKRTVTKETGTYAEIQCEMPWSVMDKDWRMVAIRRNGARVEMTSPDMPGTSAATVKMGMSVEVPPEDIAKFVIEARDYDWVTIRNLPLAGKTAPNP